MSASGCVFCRIVEGEIDADVLHRGEQVVAFRDIHPQAPVHVQVVPRRHLKDASALTSEDSSMLAELFAVARAVADSEGISGRGYRLVFNIGRDAANTIPHLHLHVLGGRALGWPPG